VTKGDTCIYQVGHESKQFSSVVFAVGACVCQSNPFGHERHEEDNETETKKKEEIKRARERRTASQIHICRQ
jgi:hypothetical protein